MRLVITISAALGTLLLTSPAAADVAPGDRITTENASNAQDLLSPGMNWCVAHGFPLTITATKPIALPRVFTEATEKYSSQVKLSDDGLRMTGYVAGRPFPGVEANDALAPWKIMHNYNYALAFDDVDVRNFDLDTGSISTDRPFQVQRHFVGDDFRRLYYVGRLYVDPTPEIPNREGYQYKETLHPFTEPFDLKGVGLLYYRYVDPTRRDDAWLYTPAAHRVRRLPATQQSEALFGQDTDQDSYYGYSGQIGSMEWRLVGSKTMLASLHAPSFPVKWATGAADWAFESDWEKRDVWIVEGRSKGDEYSYSKRVLYIDKDLYVIPYSDMYDRRGELWKAWINHFKWDTQAFPGSPVSYDEPMPISPGIVMVDVQRSHATKGSAPSDRADGEPGWYWHQGEKSGTSENEFTIAALIASGR